MVPWSGFKIAETSNEVTCIFLHFLVICFSMKSKEELLEKVHILLDTAEIPIKYQSIALTKILDSSREDMVLKAELMNKGVRFCCYERGELILDKYVNDEILIEYLIVREVIESFCNEYFNAKCKDEGYFDNAGLIHAKEAAFTLLGSPYYELYKEKVTKYIV